MSGKVSTNTSTTSTSTKRADPLQRTGALKLVLPLFLTTAGVISLFAFMAQMGLEADGQPPTKLPPDLQNFKVSAAAVDQSWGNSKTLSKAERADDLTILRRLHLALVGTVPSLEEIRAFEEMESQDRIAQWTNHLLMDPRVGDYLAQRLGKVFVGIEDGQFIVFRRDRLNQWLAREILDNRPYDKIVQQMISEKGLWTGRPAGNFITAAVTGEEVDENKLAGRSARAFLGQRMDCAQCHDHFFAQWKQHDFEGLAAFYAPVRISAVGLEDQVPFQYVVEDSKAEGGKRTVDRRVPFGEEWVPAQGTERQKLAQWITHEENRRFDRAIVNRIWGLMFGKPLVEPVDDLPDPPVERQSDPLDVLADEFRTHGRSLHWLIQVIVQTQAFQQESRHPSAENGDKFDVASENWAMYPLTRLRPEQIIGNMLQAWSLQTIDQNSHVFVRLFRLFRERDFLKEYGDTGEEELALFTGTIPQALLRMNGEFSRQLSEATPLSAAGRLASLSNDREELVTGVFLACLTRRPTAKELQLIEAMRQAHPVSNAMLAEDLYWTLFNSPEFSWNH
ncbi:hypothetical protein Spb1_26710 [Planctopirus ephydatiae]|uniref:Cytochrome c domain-containing protein n=1 Tax=Planctopirus ephydatiae TaxID=2528019 RepID=A0A518GQ41_9PLAN|nr:DUF1549 domain-containing protein [Planctopirus ephydatiae]QDV30737.1 hypothetical protein Spb1_26710 [Planctopirus ephydatiae]